MTRIKRGSGGALIFLLLLHGILPASPTEYGTPEELCKLQQEKIDESSGLAASNRHPGLLWTHNDSGDKPRLFAFDMQGKHRGTSYLRGADARDWEDMGSFVVGENACLFVADVGGNIKPERENYVIYVAREPESPKKDCPIIQRIQFVYDDGAVHDCEAVALDVDRREFLLFEKHGIDLQTNAHATPSNVWLIEWDTTKRQQRTVARKIGSIDIPPIQIPFFAEKIRLGARNAVTAADISPDGRRAIVATYLGGLEICRMPNQDWAQAIKNPSYRVFLPPRRQGESVCYGTDGVTLFLTSEKAHCPLFKVPVATQADLP